MFGNLDTGDEAHKYVTIEKAAKDYPISKLCTLLTFRQAWKQQKDVTGLIVHSDQGFQYTSHAYHDMLPKVGARISMSRRGNCYDNASMESFFSHLKTEGLLSI
ncbi:MULTISPECIES: DDE-type integrase/transposase/recombinase [Paenibacillus]|uniref:DDE-type integrase/transposase/recombinase n=1 Tax=Paenibacillus peoriae TaxID=59893 RepID=A0A7H0YD90_9BACL|nr:hypothetical protein C1T21_09390 [Paenibacillus sp. F4]QNR69048.1 DDE-type integrase/transposase/recombinase [Paenibacillus peoriae]